MRNLGGFRGTLGMRGNGGFVLPAFRDFLFQMLQSRFSSARISFHFFLRPIRSELFAARLTKAPKRE